MARIDRLTCEEMLRRIDDFMDRELGAEEAMLVEQHLETCARCAEEYRFDETMLRETRAKLSRVQAPAGLFDKIRRRLAEPTEDGS